MFWKLTSPHWECWKQWKVKAAGWKCVIQGHRPAQLGSFLTSVIFRTTIPHQLPALPLKSFKRLSWFPHISRKVLWTPATFSLLVWAMEGDSGPTCQADLEDFGRSLRSLGTLSSQLWTSRGAAGLGTWTSQAGDSGSAGSARSASARLRSERNGWRS